MLYKIHTFLISYKLKKEIYPYGEKNRCHCCHCYGHCHCFVDTIAVVAANVAAAKIAAVSAVAAGTALQDKPPIFKTLQRM